jgi:tetratricopeptide (TPR) repeat protein
VLTALIVLQLWCLWVAQYSITILLFVIASVVLITLIGIFERKIIPLVVGGLCLVGIGVMAVLLVMPLIVPGTQSLLSKTEVAEPTTTTSAETLDLNSLGNRTLHWRNTMDMIIASPEVPFSNDNLLFLRKVVGYGPEMFTAVYQGFFPEKLRSTFTQQSMVLDHPHNHYLYVAATSGILGLTGYIAVLCIFFLLSLRSLRRVSKHIDRLLLLAGIAIVIGFMADNMFNPVTISTHLVFWFVLGNLLVVGRIASSETNASQDGETNEDEKQQNTVSIESGRSSLLYGGSLICIVLIVIGAAVVTLRPMLADMHLRNGLNLQAQQSEHAISEFSKMVEKQPNEAVYWGFIGQYSYIRALYMADESLREAFFESSVAAYQRALELEPFVAYRYYTLADVYAYQAWTGDEEKWPLAFSFYEQSLQLFPENAVIYDKWARALFSKGDIEDARLKLEHAKSADLSWSITAFLAALIDIEEGLTEEGVQATILHVADNPDSLLLFADVCMDLLKYDMVNTYVNSLEAYENNETDGWIVHSLIGIVRYYTGDYAESISAFDMAMGIVPDDNVIHIVQPVIKIARANWLYQQLLADSAGEWNAKVTDTVDDDVVLSRFKRLVNVH